MHSLRSVGSCGSVALVRHRSLSVYAHVPMINVQPLKTAVDVSFWNELSNRKLRVYMLDDSAKVSQLVRVCALCGTCADACAAATIVCLPFIRSSVRRCDQRHCQPCRRDCRCGESRFNGAQSRSAQPPLRQQATALQALHPSATFPGRSSMSTPPRWCANARRPRVGVCRRVQALLCWVWLLQAFKAVDKKALLASVAKQVGAARVVCVYAAMKAASIGGGWAGDALCVDSVRSLPSSVSIS